MHGSLGNSEHVGDFFHFHTAKDAELDHPPEFISLQMILILALQVLMVFLFLPPLLVAGYVINLPTHFLVKAIAGAAAKLEKDVATVKLGLGLLLYPLTWALWAIATARGFLHLGERYPALPDAPWAFAFTVFALGALGGAVALRYLRLLDETKRALEVRRTRRQGWVSVGRLLGERQALFDALSAMVADVELPGTVTVAGLVVE